MIKMMFFVIVMVTIAKADKMRITNISDNVMVRQGESVNMSCQTDQVLSTLLMNLKLLFTRNEFVWIWFLFDVEIYYKSFLLANISYA